jgi:transglutaminase-like putative cysteine protease
MRYTASHTTRYRYDAIVSQCQSEVRLTPRALPWQTPLESRIHTSPEPAWVDVHKDYFGNEVTTCTILERHDRFTIVATSVVDVQARPALPDADTAWETVRDALAAHAQPATLEASEYVFDSPFVGAHEELAAYARPSFPAGRGLREAVDDLSHRIHAEFTYAPHATSIETPLLDALKARRGVCQDFSHVMIGALRSLGLAARYVSGYLQSGASYQGAEASHAWVSVYLPGAGWIDVDPTNDVRPGTGHVTLGWGRDYGDVTPVKGIALGGGQQLVEVEVRVDAIDGGALIS